MDHVPPSLQGLFMQSELLVGAKKSSFEMWGIKEIYTGFYGMEWKFFISRKLFRNTVNIMEWNLMEFE
jgi:hypothetical protein